ncbi:uncharacterized protein LOC129256599 [Lytechinus pictus]|uniref:uncharacterized protein LOC129256599 n=1 Tax=Lytechinus pictus TaxID=7653 RepID=UPI00240DBBF1|nr:uncharacterized protein LOC129256599 [Lytechinus pictus]
MKSLTILVVVLALVLLVACVDASKKKGKHDKHRGRGGGHPHDHHHDHHHDHRHDHGRDHSHDHHPEYSQHEVGYRHRRDIINGTEENDTMSTLEPGRCTKVVSVTVTFAQSFQKSRKVPKIVRCGWLHLAKCKVYKLEYETAYRTATRVQYAIVRKCCPGFMEVNGVCEPIGGRTTPAPPTTPTTAAPTTTAMQNTTDVPDDYKIMIDDKIQKIVSAVIILVLILFTGCCIGACLVYICKCCHGKKGSYV